MRRSKEDAEKTRQRIVAAAAAVFARQGVGRTSMEQIARAAGVTRGAVYWHFANKQALYYAMREQVTLPMIDRVDLALERGAGADALGAIEDLLAGILEALVRDPATRCALDIINYKCEYVDELAGELEVHRLRTAEFVAKLERAYRRAKAEGALRAGLPPELAARDTCAFVVGQIRLWLMDAPRGALMRRDARALIRAHVDQKCAVQRVPKAAAAVRTPPGRAASRGARAIPLHR